ncbi:TlpA family protein disulfide reductase [Nonomuraea insulae]|uniref:TlpA family protein disulfide reductase n=1 Tax=Nonomuraea insulae TaxID=1616787 RepID=A0ABW1D174_9ACTN
MLINSLVLFRLAMMLRPVFVPPKEKPEIPSLAVGADLPSFHAETTAGSIVSSEDFGEHGAGIVFMSHDCPSCRGHFPNLEKIRRLAQICGDRLVLVGYTDNFSVQEAEAVLRGEFGFEGDVVVVGRRHVLRHAYNPRGATPFFYYVKNGVVVNKGGLDTEHWAETVRSWQTSARQISESSGPREHGPEPASQTIRGK